MNASTPDSAALALFQAGRLTEAESAWRAILAVRPEDAQALHVLGLILARTGRRDEGLALIDRSIERAPREPALLNNRALILSEAGRLPEAERDLRRALQLEPRFAAGLLHLASLLRQQRRFEEALAACRRVLQVEPRSPDAHTLLGNTLRDQGDANGARAAYAAALAIDPHHGSVHFNRGNLALEEGDLALAEASFAQALKRDPRHAMAHNNLGVVLRRSGRIDEARARFEQALAVAPTHAEALNNLGLVLQQLGRGAQARERYAAAVAARPDFAGAWTNWGNLLKDEGDLEGAAALYDRALALAPGFADALNNRANVAFELRDLDLAKRLYARALAARPDYIDPRFSLAQVALYEGDFAQGWEGYELRFSTSPPMATARALPQPRLEGADQARGARVALWREQGIGDQILFSTLLPELVAAGAQLTVELDSRLVALYARALPQVTFVPPERAQEAFAACDRQLPLGSLPLLFRRSRASFERQPPALLAADPARVAEFKARLGPGRWLAVSWRSLQKSDRRHLERRKSMPVATLAALASVSGLRLLDIQYGDVTEDREAFEESHPGLLSRLDGLDTYNDFAGLLAAIEACEGVVTVSNVTAHLAGVIGKRTHLIYPAANAPFHYWVPDARGRSPWYPSVEIVTAPQWTLWSSVMEEVAKRLAHGV